MIHEVQICSDIDIVFMKHMNKQKVIWVVVSNLFFEFVTPEIGENEPFLRNIFSTGFFNHQVVDGFDLSFGFKWFSCVIGDLGFATCARRQKKELLEHCWSSIICTSVDRPCTKHLR